MCAEATKTLASFRTPLWAWLVLTAWAAPLLAQYEPPADYYASITGNPATLSQELHLVISDSYWLSLVGPGGVFVPDGSGHQERSYEKLKLAIPVIDGDPDWPGNLILAYSGESVDATWDAGETWNREHRWPVARGVGTNGPDFKDMHHLAPCKPSINYSHGNSPFGTLTSLGVYGRAGSYFYPGDADQPERPEFGDDTGDVARAMFYMAVRYDGDEENTVDLELTNGLPGDNQMGDLAALLVWHYRDVPSTFELRRNHLIFHKIDNPLYYQGNRNPFVDRPEYAWAVFGDGANDSKLYLGDTPPADGASSLTVDFGVIPADVLPPVPREVILNKGGDDPTYFRITASGAAACHPSGRYNAFGQGCGSRTLSVGLTPESTATAGSKTGTITIENLELTDQGPGTGRLDAFDAIDVRVEVRAYSCPRPYADFDEDGDVDQVDFAAFQACYSQERTYQLECTCFDRDRDGAVNGSDFNAFQQCARGPAVPADAGCGNNVPADMPR